MIATIAALPMFASRILATSGRGRGKPHTTARQPGESHGIPPAFRDYASALAVSSGGITTLYVNTERPVRDSSCVAMHSREGIARASADTRSMPGSSWDLEPCGTPGRYREKIDFA